MQQARIAVAFVLLAAAATSRADSPRMEDVVRAPADYAGKKLRFAWATLSGRITPYDAGGVRKYYLTVLGRSSTFEIGFFLAPPPLADKLVRVMNPRRNYRVNLRCKVQTISINGFEQWRAIVSRVSFLDEDGDVIRTVKAGKK
jgi:hypothetical protein